jgi:hypothetical protein
VSFAQSKKWVFSLPNNVSSSNVQPQQKRKVDREKKMRAPDIRTVVRDQIASFDDLLIVEGVFHVVVQVFAAHGARVSQSSNVSPPNFVGLLYLQNRDRKRSRRLRRLRRRHADRNRTNESKGFL